MTATRFEFQRSCVKLVDGRVANVGCNDDPAALKQIHPETVNCDFYTSDPVTTHIIPADKVFDCTKERWPFIDNSCDMVVLGDILEHLEYAGQTYALNEAHRVAGMLCITVPNDPRWETETEQERTAKEPKGSYHVITVTENHLRNLLRETGWMPIRWRTVDYGFCPEGYFVLAVRRSFPKPFSKPA